jgi:hypothetical protein
MKRTGKGRGSVRALRLAALFLLLVPLGAAAHAADEEIQVYMDEMNPSGGYGLDLHLNYVPKGRHADVDFAGEEASAHRLRLTPEFSYGLTDHLELGAYLPLTEIDGRGHFELGGIKGRVKFIAPHRPGCHFFWGANFELGHVRRRLDINPWNAELKGIGGWRKGPLTLAANLNFDFVVSGPAPAPATFEIAIKTAYQLKPGFSIGFESYNDLGDTHRLRLDGNGNRHLFAVIDKNLGRFDLNFGVGYGYGPPDDRWVVKAIVGISIDPRQR